MKGAGYIAFVLSLLLGGYAHAQERQIRVLVRDSTTGQPMPGVVIWADKALGQTDRAGSFLARISVQTPELRITSVGYNTRIYALKQVGDTLDVQLQPGFTHLQEVKITKKKYRNKGNPAVQLIRQVIENKPLNRNLVYGYYKEHEKVRIGLVNSRERLLKHPVVRLFPALQQNFDSVRVEGRVFLPLYVQELLNEYATEGKKSVSGDSSIQTAPGRPAPGSPASGSPASGHLKKKVLEERTVSLDENLFDREGIKMYIAHAYQPFDIYDNNMMVITNQFVSPISDLAPAFYMYDITDTVKINGSRLVKLLFTPRNSTDFLFWGDMKVDLDTYAVTEINLRIGKGINLNWARNLEITQHFSRNPEGRYSLSVSNVAMEFSILAKSRESVLTERLVTYYDYRREPPAEPETAPAAPVRKGASEPIGAPSEYDEKIYSMLDSLKDTRRFKTLTGLIGLAAYGYFNTGPYVETGPVSTFVGRNQLEGFRLRLGGRTLPAFSNRIFLEGFGAYGFDDQRWKYNAAVTWSFTGKNKYVFPMKNITAAYRSDIEIPGNNLRYTFDHSFLLSIPRGEVNKWVYYKRFTLRYVQEFENRLSYRLGLEHTVQNPAGTLFYRREGTDSYIRDFTTAEIKGEFRYAPKERFYQGKTDRSSLTSQYPVFTLRGSWGFSGLYGSTWDYRKLSLNIDKRFLLSPLGYLEANFEAGGTFGKNLPFPLLDIMRANQSYTFQQWSYNMMNFMEFVADRFTSLKLEHNFNGALLNKIPLISRLKFREYATFKILYGSLQAQNRPGHNVFVFPLDAQGNPAMFALGRKPYMEGSLGVGNILKLFRVDVVKRFTYRDHPGISGLGIRVRADMDF